ncbi:glycosyltransferase [Filimonas lacunae]|nr:glycosyltransferase [Filimonas lacunae]
MGRFARQGRVFYVEEPQFHATEDHFVTHVSEEAVIVIQPHLEKGAEEADVPLRQYLLLKALLDKNRVTQYMCWYYTPMALPLGSLCNPHLVVYDCMDELSAFKFAPPELKRLEKKLLASAHLVFTGGQSLYEVRKHQHANIHPFPSSIDKAHFHKARTIHIDPADQQHIPYPRLGFCGVLDERLDIPLLTYIATQQPAWQLVLVGPVVKIEPDSLPQLPNIHYLGAKAYADLPAYLSGWDLAMICFALNESTRYISPTKTPEYLAAGKPVVSTAITDVVNPYGIKHLVHIARTPQEFVEKAASELAIQEKEQWLKSVDNYLVNMSWDGTVRKMLQLIETARLHNNTYLLPAKIYTYAQSI